MAVAPGTLLGRYHIISPLGAGGMGEVYLAQDTRLGRRVAIKFPTVKTDAHHAHARFLREARSISVLSHRNIATLYDYGENDGQPFLVMELVSGESLSDLMHSNSLTLSRSVEIIISIAEALSEAHRMGIIHRDIKPSNVMINERGEVKVLDFGLAKQLGEEPVDVVNQDAETLLATRTQSGVVVGTPLYLSPEQAMSAPVDARSDIFALGALLYECITGSSAFIGKGIIEITAKIIHVDPPAPSSINPLISPELDRITLKALAKAPEARYQSAQELLEELRSLRSILSDEQHLTQRISPAVKTAQSSAIRTLSDMLQRPRVSVGRILLGGAAIGLIVFLAWFILMRETPYEPTTEARSWYEKGLNAMREGAYYHASTNLQNAVKADGNFALAHASLAEAWTELDYADRGRDSQLRSEALIRERPALKEQDKFYLDAVNAMVTRDYKRAINAYTSIAQLLPDQPQVYVDLGRAYERNEDHDKAIEMYQEATKRDGQYALAFLRVATLYGRKDTASAFASFDKAESLYRTQNNYEGVAEVLFQRGSLYDKLDKTEESRKQLEQALEFTRNMGNQFQQIKTMLQLSSVYMTGGDRTQAKRVATEAINLARTNGMETLTAQGLIELGNVHYYGGETAEAENYFKQALEAAQRHQGQRNEARARLSLGSMYIQQGKADQGLPYVEQALQFFQERGYRRETTRALTLIGYSKDLKGDYDAALAAFTQQLEVAQQTGEPTDMAQAHDGMGLVLSQIERYPEALNHFRESYAIYTSQDNKINKAYCLMNRGEILGILGSFNEAQSLFKQALEITEEPKINNKKVSAMIYLETASLYLKESLFSEAKAALKKTMDLDNDSSKNSKYQAILSLTSTHTGARAEGQRLSESAVEVAERENNQPLLKEALIALAEAQLEAGDAQAARATALKLIEMATRVKFLETEWRARLIAARASLKLNEGDTAREHLARANNLLTQLQTTWGSEAYNQYLTRRDILFYRQQAGEPSIATQ